MWPFLRNSMTKMRLRATFGNFLSEEALRRIQQMSNERSRELPSPEKEEICYIVLQVCGDTPEEIQHHLSFAIDIVIDDGGVVEDIMSSIVTATFKPTPALPQPRANATAGKLGANVRAVVWPR
jgi:hypothetical protein